MVDTPGHADFGGEVERVVGMVEGAILVVDAGEGPQALTKFVLAKALKYGLRPIRLLNKVDRPSVTEERCDEVESLVFNLFANRGASEEQLDFPVLYASAKEGWASSTFTKCPADEAKNMSQLLDTIISHVPPPSASIDAPFQMLVSMMERDSYLGRILTGCIFSGMLCMGDKVNGLRESDSGTLRIEEGKVLKLVKKKGTSMVLVDSACAGYRVSMAGLTKPAIGHTVANVEVMTALPTVDLDPPTISMTFGVDDSPLAGRDGTHVNEEHVGLVLDALSHRWAEVVEMGPVPCHSDRTIICLTCPSMFWGLVVFSSDTRGTGFIHRAFMAYEKFRGPLGNVRKGVLVSMGRGAITAYALMSLEPRGILFVTPGMEI